MRGLRQDPPTSSTTGSLSTSPGAMGPKALRRAFTLENLQFLCSSCHRRKTRLDRRLSRFLSACSDGLAKSSECLETEPRLG